MSANAFGADWAQMESGTLRTGQRPFRDPLNQKRRFLPLRLDGTAGRAGFIVANETKTMHSSSEELI